MFDIEKYKKDIVDICKRYHVKNLTVFGSALTASFHDHSDIDFLIELDSTLNGLNRYMNTKFELEKLFKRPVDLVMPNAIKNDRIKSYIFSNTREIYVA